MSPNLRVVKCRLVVVAVAVLCLSVTLGQRQGDAQQPTVDDFRKQSDLATAQKDAITAQMALDAAKKAQQDALNPDPAKAANDAKVATANAQKAVSDAQASASNAAKAKADADASALQAQFGSTPTSGYTGAVDLKDKAGSTEAALLAARAINLAAGDVISRPAFLSAVKGKQVWLFALADLPNFNSLLLYRSYSVLLNSAIKEADATASAALSPAGIKYSAGAAFAPAAIGLGLDAANKLLSFFKTDYAVGGIDVAYDDTALVHSMAGKLSSSFPHQTMVKGKISTTIVDAGVTRVVIPATFNEAALSRAGQPILDEFTQWFQWSGRAQRHIDDLKLQQKDLSDAASREIDPLKKASLESQAKACAVAIDALGKGKAVYDIVIGKLTLGDDKGNIPLASVIREKTIFDLLNPESPASVRVGDPPVPVRDGVVLLVKVQKAGGAYYTKKNLWTIFGGLPLYHMGGVVLSFVLIGREGAILDSGLTPLHGGFVKASKLTASLADQ